jgi:RHS repeat-associated protein
MSIYESGQTTGYNLTQTEVHLYGSSRLGILNTSVNVQSGNLLVGNTGNTIFTRGEQFFELSNHLQNVLVTVSDKKLQHTSNNVVVDYYMADVVTANDYYPFGMMMPGRKYTANTTTAKYRFSINGQEKETELNENITTAEYWEYDSRLGRRWNRDPKPTIGVSPYACFLNNPIVHIDALGDTVLPTVDGRNVTLPTAATGITTFDGNVKDLLNSTVKVQPPSGTLNSFSINGKNFVATFGDQTGNFLGYYNGDLSYNDYAAQQAASGNNLSGGIGIGLTGAGGATATGAMMPAIPLAGYQIGWNYGATHSDQVTSWVTSIARTTGGWFGLPVADVDAPTTVPPAATIRIALSVNEHLGSFSMQTMSLPYWDWGYQPSEQTALAYGTAITLLGTLPNVEFHFNLTDKREGRIDSPVNLSSRANSITTTEYTTIMSNPMLRAKTTFYIKSGSIFKKL